jgi:hypothetical protein
MQPLSKTQSDDLRANLALAIDRAADRINGQRAAADALDAKGLGALALAAAGVGTLAAVSSALAYWWIGAAIMGVAGMILGYVVWPRSLDVGPDPGKFYDKYGGLPAVTYANQLLTDLLDSIAENDRQAPGKVRALKWGSAFLTAGLVAAVIAAIEPTTRLRVCPRHRHHPRRRIRSSARPTRRLGPRLRRRLVPPRRTFPRCTRNAASAAAAAPTARPRVANHTGAEGGAPTPGYTLALWHVTRKGAHVVGAFLTARRPWGLPRSLQV